MTGRLIAKTPIKGEPGQYRELIREQDNPGVFPDFFDCWGGKKTHVSRVQALQLFESMKIQEVSFSEAFCHLHEIPDSDIESEFMRRKLGDPEQLSFEKPLRACTIPEIKDELKRRDIDPEGDQGAPDGQLLLKFFKGLDQEVQEMLLLRLAALDPQRYMDPVPDDMVMEEAGRRNSAF